MHMKKIFTGILTFLLFCGYSQKNVKLQINHKLINQNFALQQSSTNNLGNSFSVNRMQYYMSQFSVIHDGGQNTAVTGTYALVDAAPATTTTVDLGMMNVTNVEGIKFFIGVNTPENNQDPALLPSSHPLSPKNPSMHWGWASGYFFVAMSGMGGASLNNVFELHGLGNVNYFGQTITTTATVNGNELIIPINADYAQALKNINVASGVVSHGASGMAATIVANFRDFVFSAVTSGSTVTGVSEDALIVNNNVILYPNPSVSGIFLLNSVSFPKTAITLRVTDVAGRVIQIINLKEITAKEITLEKKGVYFIDLLAEDKTLYTQKVVSL